MPGGNDRSPEEHHQPCNGPPDSADAETDCKPEEKKRAAGKRK